MWSVIAGDAFISFLWVFCASTVSAITQAIKNALQVDGGVLHRVIYTSVTFALVYIFYVLSDALRGASFVPTVTASFYAAGAGDDDLVSLSLRFPAQAVGGVVGASAIWAVAPWGFRNQLDVPVLKVEESTGAVAEGVFTFLICLVELSIREVGSYFNKSAFLTIPTVLLVDLGANYTGPAINPAYAFGWAFIRDQHNTWGHFYVYWIHPFIAAFIAGWAFRIMFPE